MSKQDKIKVVVISVLITAALYGIYVLFGGPDYLKAWSYQPSSEMAKIIENLGLTGRGDVVLKASNPNLDTREVFNKECDSHQAEVYVLGCYLTGDDEIHLYNIDAEELDGVKESTTAHELLHAIWNRLPFWEKSGLEKEMQAVYDTLPDDNEIKESMKLYSGDNFYDELHSRLGTEIKDLPEKLENHYQSVFKDQDKIVAYYEKYSSKFRKLEKELDALNKKIDEEKKQIDEETVRLELESEKLNQKIDAYNKKIVAGNYKNADLTALQNEANELGKEIDRINDAYVNLNKIIDEYNKLIDEYNNSVVRTNELMESMNSNSNKVESLK